MFLKDLVETFAILLIKTKTEKENLEFNELIEYFKKEFDI